MFVTCLLYKRKRPKDCTLPENENSSESDRWDGVTNTFQQTKILRALKRHFSFAYFSNVHSRIRTNVDQEVIFEMLNKENKFNG